MIGKHIVQSAFAGIILTGICAAIMGQPLYDNTMPLDKLLWKIIVLIRNVCLSSAMLFVLNYLNLLHFKTISPQTSILNAYIKPFLFNWIIVELLYSIYHSCQHSFNWLWHFTGHSVHHSITEPYPIDTFYFGSVDFVFFNLIVFTPLVIYPCSRITHFTFLCFMSVMTQLEHTTTKNNDSWSWFTNGHEKHHNPLEKGCFTVMTFGLCAKESFIVLSSLFCCVWILPKLFKSHPHTS